MKKSGNADGAGKKLKKLIIVSMLVCYVPFSSGCAGYVMLALQVVSMVSSMVAQQREQKARREAWQKGEPYIEDSATTNWKTASNLAGMGSMLTSFGSQAGWWGGNNSGGGTTATGLNNSSAQQNSVGNGGQSQVVATATGGNGATPDVNTNAAPAPTANVAVQEDTSGNLNSSQSSGAGPYDVTEQNGIFAAEPNNNPNAGPYDVTEQNGIFAAETTNQTNTSNVSATNEIGTCNVNGTYTTSNGYNYDPATSPTGQTQEEQDLGNSMNGVENF